MFSKSVQNTPRGSSLDSKIKPVNLKGKQPWILNGRTDANAEALVFGHLMRTANSLEKSLMVGGTEDRRRRGHQTKEFFHQIIKFYRGGQARTAFHETEKEKGPWSLEDAQGKLLEWHQKNEFP